MRQLLSIALLLSICAIGCASKSRSSAATPAPEHTTASEKVDKVVADVKASSKNAAAKTETAMAGHSSKLECTHGKEVRVLEVRTKDKGCELGYTKGGQEAVVSSGSNGTGHCDGSLTKIKDKLIAAGYTCK